MSLNRNILTGTIILFIVLGLASWSLIPQYDLIVFPEIGKWPEDVISAAKRFSSLPPAERGNDAKAVESFILWSCEKKRVRPIDYFIAHKTILCAPELEAIMGRPSLKLQNRYYYFCEGDDGNTWSLVFGFQHHALASVGISAGEDAWKAPR